MVHGDISVETSWGLVEVSVICGITIGINWCRISSRRINGYEPDQRGSCQWSSPCCLICLPMLFSEKKGEEYTGGIGPWIFVSLPKFLKTKAIWRIANWVERRIESDRVVFSRFFPSIASSLGSWSGWTFTPPLPRCWPFSESVVLWKYFNDMLSFKTLKGSTWSVHHLLLYKIVWFEPYYIQSPWVFGFPFFPILKKGICTQFEVHILT